MKRIKVIAYSDEFNSKDLVKHAKTVFTKISVVPSFTSLNVFIPFLQAAINKADTANTLQKEGDKSTTSAVRAAAAELKRILRKLAADVEFIAADDETIALSSGFDIKKPSLRVPKSFNAKQGAISGTVLLEINSHGSAAYQWEMSEDATSNFSIKDVTVKSKTTITGLTPGVKYWFRVGVITSKGKQEYTDPYMVHVV